ncbi:MAG: hypothetical protein GY858_03355 [Candidatus Omnitrophica bacterium]|nr:hypothetical protein [Candidatus Omnitrophota bacterium]
MVNVIKLIGILTVAIGAIYLVKPTIMKNVLNFWMKGKRIYLGGLISLVIGVVFLVASSRCTMQWFIFLMGLLSLAKGVAIFIMGPKKFAPLCEKLLQSPIGMLRVFAVIALIFGVLVIFSI